VGWTARDQANTINAIGGSLIMFVVNILPHNISPYNNPLKVCYSDC
jgi:hypothetical protein